MGIQQKTMLLISGTCLLFTLSMSAQKQSLTTNGQSFEHEKRKRHHHQMEDMSNCPDSPYRTIDGTCNNRFNNRMDWGATDIPLLRDGDRYF